MAGQLNARHTVGTVVRHNSVKNVSLEENNVDWAYMQVSFKIFG